MKTYLARVANAVAAVAMAAITIAATAITAVALTGCASDQGAHEKIATDARVMFAALPAIVARPVVSDFDEMRAALPAFSLERSSDDGASYGDISVIRDISFLTDRDILSDADVARLESLKSYLRTHATVAVRIEGYGDGTELSERETDLSLARAQAVKRALLTDIMISNTIDCIGGARSRPARRNGSAEIIFIRPAA